ncbi:MAG: alpha/beta fold hydrolase [Gemmatimonadaceae bacterium]
MTRLRFLLVLLLAGAAQRVPAQSASPSPARVDVVANDGHKLVLWGKRPAGTAKGEIVLLHGRTWSSLPNFDLQVRGQHVSLMDAFVAQGYAVYALDQRGYGSTKRDATGWLTPSRAMMDAVAALDWVALHSPGGRRPALLGYSRGSATAMLVAQSRPAAVSALVMYGAYYNIDIVPDLIPEPKTPPRELTTAEGAGEDFITPASTPAGAKDAYVREALRDDPVRVDWRREEEFRALDPAKLHVPTLLINGDRDPYAASANLPLFISRVEGVDHAWFVLANADHVAHIEKQGAFVSAIVSFLKRD